MNVSLIKDSLDQRQKRITEADFLQLISELFRSRLKKNKIYIIYREWVSERRRSDAAAEEH
jgi:hypothetical protein